MELAIGLAQHGHNARRAQPARSQPDQIQLHPNLSTGPTQKRGFSHHGDLLDDIVDLRDDTSQHLVIVALAVKSQRQNRDIINGSGLDEWKRDAEGNPVEVGSQFFREAHEARLGI
jgi:hypothetical protein